MAEQTNSSPDAIEAEIAQTRAHLARTVDELAFRTRPREIVRTQTESAKDKVFEATHTPDGELRVERVSVMAAAASLLLVLLAVRRVRRRRG